MISLLGSAGATGTTSPVTATRTTTTGSLLVALLSRSSATDAFTGVTDTAGNTWQQAVFAPTSGTVGRRVEIWYCQNATSVTSVSAAFSATQTAAITLHEFAGVATSGALVTSFAKVQSSSTTPTAAQVTPTDANDLVIGHIRANTGVAQTYTLTASGYTTISVPIAEHHGIAYRIGGTPNVATGPTWTLGSASGSGSATAVFKAAPTTPTDTNVKYWNGTQWVEAKPAHPVKYWNGSTWVQPAAGKIKYWDGNTWTPVV